MIDDYEDEDIHDAERERPASNDPNGYGRIEAEQQSRRCPHCRGLGLKTIFDFDYIGSPIITGLDDQGDPRHRAARTCAYCTCLYGRWILENHKKACKDVYGRTPDLADIVGRPSFWLDRDPTARELEPEEITRLPENFRLMMIRRVNASEANR